MQNDEIDQFINEMEQPFVDVPIETYFKIIDTDVDVSAMAERLEQNPDDWHYVGLWTTSDSTSTMPYGIIPLTVAATPEPGVNIHDSEVIYNTSYYDKYKDTFIEWAEQKFQYICRCGLLALGAGSATELKLNAGKYYENKDRYYLVVKGKGLFTIHGKEFIVNQGTLFKFNHLELHGDMNVGEGDKWVFMFDVARVNRGESGEEAVS